jgi:hypothetical protein
MSTIASPTLQVTAGPESLAAEKLAGKIRSLLDSQKLVAAMREAARGAKLFPGHAWLRQANRVLNPSKVAAVPARDQEMDRRKEYDWLRRHRDEYRGQWVALMEDELIASSESFDEVLRDVRARRLTTHPLVHRVE